MRLQIRDLEGPIGAEVLGLEPAKPLSTGELDALEETFLRRLVLRFRNAPMAPRELCAFSGQFGELQPHIAKKYRLPEAPEVVLMINQDANGNFDKVGAERGVGWHSRPG